MFIGIMNTCLGVGMLMYFGVVLSYDPTNIIGWGGVFLGALTTGAGIVRMTHEWSMSIRRRYDGHEKGKSKIKNTSERTPE